MFKRYKIASRTCLFKDPFALETLKKKASTKKPVIISMGMGGNKKKILDIFPKNNKTFCYCISEYPLKFEKIDWAIALQNDGFFRSYYGDYGSNYFYDSKKN